jgi:hypothetical protein
MLSKALQGAAKGVAVDSDFENVTLLLHGNGTNGAQNNTFTDGSSNAFSITRNGNTTQGTFSPYGDNWSNYFGGSQSINPAASTDFQLSGDFTIEAWIYTTSTVDASVFVQQSSTNYFALNVTAGTNINVYLNNPSANFTVTDRIPSANTWNHIALVRSGSGSGNLKIYLNGVASSTTATNTSTLGYNAAFYIGALGTQSGGSFNGYISNLRVVAGTAIYTSNFTPSTTPLTAVTNTKLLTCQSNRFIDTNTQVTAKTITVNGSPSVQRFSPFSPTAAYASGTIGGSGYFDGTGDYLSLAANTALNPGASTTPFSIECWLYPTSTPAENRAVYGNFKVISYPSNCDGFDMLYATNRTLVLRWGYPTYADSGGSAAMNLNTWNHLVICRNTSGSMSGFLNGARWFNTSSNTSITNSTASSFWIGWAGDLSGSTIPPFPGYISGFKMLKGTSAYDPTQTTLTVPTAPPTNTTDTSLLLNFTNAGIIDNAMMNDLETVGNAQISTSVSKFGGGSMYFDGTGDALFSPYSPNLNLGSGDFTIEGWVYFSSLPSNNYVLFASYGNSTSAQRWIFGYDTRSVTSSPGLFFTVINSSNSVIVDVPGGGTSGWATGTWYHVAITRSGSSWKLFRDGTQNGSTVTDTDAIPDPTANGLNIGTEPDKSSAAFNGYIDDLRITKGVARYTANFTAPTAPFADQ